MSDQAFEKAVADKLREHGPNVFVYHPPDDRHARQWKPADFMFGFGSHWGWIETKEVQGETFPISRWPANQRLHCKLVTEAGGTYWLVVRYMPSRAVAAFHGALLMPLERGSLKIIDGRDLTLGRSFTIDLLIATRPIGNR